MKKQLIIDTGPLVAYLKKDERYHQWSVKNLSEINYPIFTCEAVISEACFLLRNIEGGKKSVLELLNRGLISIKFDLNSESAAIMKLLARYKNVPMSFADACLVRMTELFNNSTVMTLDNDFGIYRCHGRQSIKLITVSHTS